MVRGTWLKVLVRFNLTENATQYHVKRLNEIAT
jgi:hypothetical protein